MNFSYRTEHNAKAISALWGKPIDDRAAYNIKALSNDETELFVFDVLGFPFNDINAMIRDVSSIKSNKLLVRLNSPGGDIVDSMALYVALKNHSSFVTVRIESLAASAASVIAMAGKEIQAYPTSLLMIHNSWIVTAGNRFELQKTADIMGKIDTNMQNIYSSKTNIGKREMADMMKAETWMNASEMKDKGFIDTVINGKGAKAEFDLSIFANLPAEFKAEANPDEPEQREDPDIRTIEKALRDAGLSKNKAKAVLARGWKAEADDKEPEPKKTDSHDEIIRWDAGMMARLTKNIELLSKGI